MAIDTRGEGIRETEPEKREKVLKGEKSNISRNVTEKKRGANAPSKTKRRARGVLKRSKKTIEPNVDR